jgi:hypothetical protein
VADALAQDHDPAPYEETLPAIPVRRPAEAKPAAVPRPPARLPAEVVQTRADVPATPGPTVAAVPLPVIESPRQSPSPSPPPASPSPVRADAPVVEALRCFQNKAPDQAAQALQDCDRTSRGLLSCLLPLAVRLGECDLARADPQDVATLVEQVQGLLGPLRERAALQIPKLCFCLPVAAPARFGQYELLDENRPFRPGERAALYAELRNFTCQPHAGNFQTHILTAVVIQDEQGGVVLEFSGKRTDPSLSPRQDFCQVAHFEVPPNLPAGAYTLWLKVTDVPTGRTAKRALAFRVTTVPARGT